MAAAGQFPAQTNKHEAARTDFYVFQAGQQIPQFLNHHAGMRFPDFGVGCSLKVLICKPAYARQAGRQNKHQQGFDQKAFVEGQCGFSQPGANAMKRSSAGLAAWAGHTTLVSQPGTGRPLPALSSR